MAASNTQHAVYSASGSAGWLACAGKIAMEEGRPDDRSLYADEGSTAHFLAAEMLNVFLQHGYLPDRNSTVGLKIICWENAATGQDGQCWSPQPLPEGAKERSRWDVTDEMFDYVSGYVEFVLKHAEGHYLFVEKRVHFGGAIGMSNQYGTADAIIVAQDGSWIHICDLKYGFREVSPVANSQMGLYSIGALGLWHDIQEFFGF